MVYRGNKLKEIVFPLGGIGTGSVGLTGNGSLRDFEIFGRPAKGSFLGYTHIAVAAEQSGKRTVRILNGDATGSYMGFYEKSDFSGYGYGVNKLSMAGFPHFRDVTFDGRFPIAELTFADAGFPSPVSLTAFNPFIPHDSENSSLPAAFLEVGFRNDTDSPITYTAYFTVSGHEKNAVNRKYSEENASFVFLSGADQDPGSPETGNLAIGVAGRNTGAQEATFRGGWQDAISTYWREITEKGTLCDRHYDTPNRNKTDGAVVYASLTLAPGERGSVPFVFSWSYPVMRNYWTGFKGLPPEALCWKHYYATRFENALASCRYALESFGSLKARTERFRDTLFASTLDEAEKSAISANLSTLKSPTVLRLSDGSFYGFEGVHETAGSCEGSCQHVWNYAYALAFLFPDLERSMRDIEYNYALHPETGKTDFRVKLPLGSDSHQTRACLDGQMGILFKTYREWKISGDTEWLKSVFERAKLILAYAWSDQNPDGWDRDKDGILEGRQHHTLDMELFGPSSWLESLYLVALEAGIEMAAALGDPIGEEVYRPMLENGKKYLNSELFNGSYFTQKIDITDRSLLSPYMNADATYWNAEAGEIKYQIGEGCEIDQMLGAWHAHILGLPPVFEKKKVARALDSLYRNNHKKTLRDYANAWRLFALNDEAATVMCTYPEGTKKPILPVPYCEEAMNGFEYALGGLMLAEGKRKEGLSIVRAVRNRYSGSERNPFGEIECGNNYARSMASYALLLIESGFLFDLPHGNIGFSPKKGDFASLFSVGNCYGLYEKTENETRLTLMEGTLTLSSLTLPYLQKPSVLRVDGKELPFTFEKNTLTFESTPIRQSLTVL